MRQTKQILFWVFCFSAVYSSDAAINVTIYELGNDVIVESEAGSTVYLAPHVPTHEGIPAEFINDSSLKLLWTSGSENRLGFGGVTGSNSIVFSDNMFGNPPSGVVTNDINEVESSGPSIGFRYDSQFQFVFFDYGDGYSPISNFPASYSRWGNTNLTEMGLLEGVYNITTTEGNPIMNISIVPEPSTFALYGGLFALVCVLTRRR